MLSFQVHTSLAQNDHLTKVKTLDSTLETLYGVISGEAGQKRDWELFKFLFTDDAKLIPSGLNNQSVVGYRSMTPDDYIASSGAWLKTNGFFEKEIYRVTESYGSMTHVFSTYESYKSKEDEQPFTRGINSIQLMNDGNRWWVLNIYWVGETEGNPIPKKYLPK
jgi:hypothetical protein